MTRVRHLEALALVALALLAAGAWVVWRSRTGPLFGEEQEIGPGAYQMLPRYAWTYLASGLTLVVAAVAVLVAARWPRLARRSPPVAAGLVLLGAAAMVYPSVEALTSSRTWRAGSWPAARVLLLVEPIVAVACVGALALVVAVTLLRAGPGSPAATGAAVLWGAVTAVAVVRAGAGRPDANTLIFTDDVKQWVYGCTGLVIVAAGLLVVAWCAGPPADRERLLARCRGGYGAIGALLVPLAAVDVTILNLPFEPGPGRPAHWWLMLRAALVLATSVTALGAALVPALTPVLAAVVPGLGLAAGVVNYLPLDGAEFARFDAVYPGLVAVAAPLLLAGLVAHAYQRLTRSPAPSV